MRPFTDAGGMARLKAIGRPEREYRRYRRALEAVLRLHTESAGRFWAIRGKAFDQAFLVMTQLRNC